MQPKLIVTIGLLVFVAVAVGYMVVQESRSPAAQPETTSTAAAFKPAPDAPVHQVKAYYLHYTRRCPTCLRIEKLAEETLVLDFPDAFERGELTFEAINVEEPENAHLATDFGIVTSSLVLVDMQAGQRRDWVLLDKVWKLVHDDVAFQAYVAEHARHYLEPAP